jgi:hypothetical protein
MVTSVASTVASKCPINRRRPNGNGEARVPKLLSHTSPWGLAQRSWTKETLRKTCVPTMVICVSFTMNRTRRVAAAGFLFGALFIPTDVDAATAFQIHSDPTCTNGLSLTNVKMVCTDEDSGGSSTCVFGDSAHVSGTLSIPDSGLFGKSMTSKACLYGAYPCRELQTNGDFCETFGLSEYGCPTTGEYSIEKTFDLPGDQGLSLGTMFGTTRSPWR